MSGFDYPQGSVGAKAGQTGTVGLRFTPEGSLVTGDGAPRHYESARNGKIFTISNGFAGVTAAAAWLTPVAAAAATCLTLYNPQGSGVNLALIEVGLAYVSGTIEAGAFVLNVHFNTTITATANAISKCLRPNADGAGTAAAGSAKGFSNTALTGGIAGVESLMLFGMPNVAGTTQVRNVEGMYCLREKDAVTIGAPTNGTSMVCAAWMTYAEVAQS